MKCIMEETIQSYIFIPLKTATSATVEQNLNEFIFLFDRLDQLGYSLQKVF